MAQQSEPQKQICFLAPTSPLPMDGILVPQAGLTLPWADKL